MDPEDRRRDGPCPGAERACRPTIERADVLAGKVDVAALSRSPQAAGGGLIADVARLRALTDDELIRRHDAAYRSDREGSYTR